MLDTTHQPKFHSYQCGGEWYGEEDWTPSDALDMALEKREGNEPFRIYCRDAYGDVTDITEDVVEARNKSLSEPIFMNDSEAKAYEADVAEAADLHADVVMHERRRLEGSIH